MTSARARRATQADVARIANVSQSTVSHVLRGDRGSRVGEDTRQRVLEAIRMTGYAANAAAQGLAGGRNHLIGVFTYQPVFPLESRDFYYPFLIGMEREAEALGADLLLFTSAPTRNGQRALLADGAGRLMVADGCVLLGRQEDQRDLADLFRYGFPFVFIGRRESASGLVPYAAADYVAATKQVVEHLASLGHRRIAYLGDLGSTIAFQDRIAGYRDAMRRAGLAPILLEGTGASADEALSMLLHHDITAAVVSPSALTPVLRQAAIERGLRVPEDLSLAQLGEADEGPGEDVQWTGFQIPREEMGATALRTLEGIVEGRLDPNDPSRVQITLPCTFEAGQTVGPPAERAPR